MTVCFGVVLMTCISRFRIFAGLMMVVSRFVSLRRTRCSESARSVRLMYSASSFLVRSLLMVVFPVLGVPVMSMTCFIFADLGLCCVRVSWIVVLIGSVCFYPFCIWVEP